MKIAHLAPSLDGRHGWPGRSARPLATAMAAAGHATTLLATARLADEGREGGIMVRRFKRGRPEAFCASSALARHLRSPLADYEVLHHHGVGLRTLHHAAGKARRDRMPLVVSPRGLIGLWQRDWRPRRLAEWIVHPRAFSAVAGWHAASEGEAAELRTFGCRQPICVAPDGVSLPSPVSLLGAREHWHKLCPRCAGRPTALFHGRLHSGKRVLELIDLWLETAPAEWLLLIVGPRDEYSAGELRSYVHRAIASDRVAVEDGRDHPPPYAAANLFLMPARRETFGRATGNALAAGLPALVTPGSPWAGIATAEAGWCAPWEDFGPALRRALDESPVTLEARGQRARAWIEATHSWAKSAETLAAFYAELRRTRP